MTYQYDLDALRTHKGSLDQQVSSVQGSSSTVGAAGAGQKEMYGILISQIAFPILDHSAKGGQEVLGSLATLLESVQGGMGDTITAYEATEADHIDRTREITDELGNI